MTLFSSISKSHVSLSNLSSPTAEQARPRCIISEILGGCPQSYADWTPRQVVLYEIQEATQKKARSGTCALAQRKRKDLYLGTLAAAPF